MTAALGTNTGHFICPLGPDPAVPSSFLVGCVFVSLLTEEWCAFQMKSPTPALLLTHPWCFVAGKPVLYQMGWSPARVQPALLPVTFELVTCAVSLLQLRSPPVQSFFMTKLSSPIAQGKILHFPKGQIITGCPLSHILPGSCRPGHCCTVSAPEGCAVEMAGPSVQSAAGGAVGAGIRAVLLGRNTPCFLATVVCEFLGIGVFQNRHISALGWWHKRVPG